MLDVLEGLLHYEVKELLKYAVNEQQFLQGNPKTRNPDSVNRKPETGNRNIRDPESGIRDPESRIRNPESEIENDDRKIHFSNV